MFKSIILVAAFFSTFAFLSVSTQTQAQSISDTMDWIAGKLKTDGCTIDSKNEKEVWTITSQSLSVVDLKNNLYEYRWASTGKMLKNGGSDTGHNEFTFSLTNQTPVKILAPGDGYTQYEGTNCWRVVATGKFSAKPTYKVGIYFAMSSKAMAERVKKAFDHAVTMAKQQEIF